MFGSRTTVKKVRNSLTWFSHKVVRAWARFTRYLFIDWSELVGSLVLVCLLGLLVWCFFFCFFMLLTNLCYALDWVLLLCYAPFQLAPFECCFYRCFCHKMTFYFGGYDHCVLYTTAQLTEGRSARDQPKQPPAKKVPFQLVMVIFSHSFSPCPPNPWIPPFPPPLVSFALAPSFLWPLPISLCGQPGHTVRLALTFLSPLALLPLFATPLYSSFSSASPLPGLFLASQGVCPKRLRPKWQHLT